MSSPLRSCSVSLVGVIVFGACAQISGVSDLEFRQATPNDAGVEAAADASADADTDTNSCSLGQSRCQGLVPQTCDANGIWHDAAACYSACVAGRCVECRPGERQCSENTTQVCDGDGHWLLVQECRNQACVDGACQGECSPGAKGCDGNTPRVCGGDGYWHNMEECQTQECVNGVCEDPCTPGDVRCSDNIPQICDETGYWQGVEECDDQACVGGECQGVCRPGAQRCSDNIPQVCDGGGTWQGVKECEGQACVGGVCQGVCVPGEMQCSDTAPQECDDTGQWRTGGNCQCNSGVCVIAPSCEGLPATCGPGADASCCAAHEVTGGEFLRSYDGVTNTDSSNPAAVSDFRLDVYEVTVGRFRRFVQAYEQAMIPPGAGANPNNPDDGGWDTAWNPSLPEDAAALTQALNCPSTAATWTDTPGANEHRPINCISWFEAYAFCAWDGGRLPTEAEWNYAAACGAEQRVYPWSVPHDSTTIDCSYANYSADISTGCTPLGRPNDVGSESPKGDGCWAHAGLSGNVAEWVTDWWTPTYVNPCDDCANLSSGSYRGTRGGSFVNSSAGVDVSGRAPAWPDSEHRSSDVGVRCAR